MHVLPKLALGLFLSVANIDNSVVAVKEEVFYVVSPSSDSEKFYLKLSLLGARDQEDHAREDVTCATILKSPFFGASKNVEMVDPNNVRAYARFHPERKDWFMFTRPYHMVNVLIQKSLTHQEAVFPCLAKAKGTKEVNLYLISHVYDFGRYVKSARVKIADRIRRSRGRFVFEYTSTAKNMAQLIAVAEEPAFRLDEPNILFHRGLFGELEDGDIIKEISERGRTICKFSRGRKIRICSVGLNAEEYRPEITFLPLDDRLEPECEKRELFFFRAYLECNDNKFNEWVIGCKTELVAEPGAFATYYVSLGYNPYQFLIYHPPNETSNNVPALKHHFYSYLGADNDDYYLWNEQSPLSLSQMRVKNLLTSMGGQWRLLSEVTAGLSTLDKRGPSASASLNIVKPTRKILLIAVEGTLMNKLEEAEIIAATFES